VRADIPDALADVFAEARRRVLGLWAAPPRVTVPREVVAAIDRAERPVVLAGPGVVLQHAVDGLRALATKGSFGVLNTWGAKGVFDWRSPHHLATAGLQAWDFERGGLADADLIIATGIDQREALAEWRLAPVVELASTSLQAVAERIQPCERAITVPALRAELARVTQAGWTQLDAPLPPTKVTQHYSQVVGGGLVAADPGTAGYWIARTFATTHLGGALVTADRAGTGFAVACAAVARLADPDRPVLAVVDQIDDRTQLALETASRLGVTVAVEVWDLAGPVLDAEAHLLRLQALVGAGGEAAIATDPAQMDEMLAVAGPIVAWTH
jgi:thiamine pyrophosphate-dependent acetolactate synthase large subunit-like protein